MNFLDLFSGIGGFALAARNAGWTFDGHYFSEVHAPAVRLYQQHFPESRSLGDVRGIEGAKLREESPGDWIVTGGFPCQDLSTAGRKAGIHGARSGLWFEMLRVVRELRPKYVLIENVAALVTRGLDRVLCALAESGLDAEWEVVPAYAVDLPHRRERVFVVAYPRGALLPSDGPLFPQGRYVGDDQQPQYVADREDFLAQWRAAVERDYAGQVHPEPIIARSSNGFPAAVDRVAGLGNAVVPAIAERILKRLREADYSLAPRDQSEDSALTQDEIPRPLSGKALRRLAE